ncbi:DUF2153 family protein [Candidatus Bathyarchaeota archaeon]|nr:DUF2153 family protein [Candidatus Bathyarchaeota archaeon]
MAENWFSQSQELLKALEEVASRKKEDRFELFSAMVFAINAIDKSLFGWKGWMQNLQLMSKFSEDELREMKGELIKEAQGFIKYDVEVSTKYKDKIPQIIMREEGRERPGTGAIV